MGREDKMGRAQMGQGPNLYILLIDNITFYISQNIYFTIIKCVLKF